MKMKSVVNAQATSEESVTCIAEKEDRHQNITSSDALKKGVEEPWTMERVAKFVDSVGHRQITLKSDRTRPLGDESAFLPWLLERAGCILSRCQKGGDGKTPFERLNGKYRRKNFFRLLRRCWQNKSPQIR